MEAVKEDTLMTSLNDRFQQLRHEHAQHKRIRHLLQSDDFNLT